MGEFRGPDLPGQAADAAAVLAGRHGLLPGKVLHAAALALAARHSYGEAAAKARPFFCERDWIGNIPFGNGGSFFVQRVLLLLNFAKEKCWKRGCHTLW